MRYLTSSICRICKLLAISKEEDAHWHDGRVIRAIRRGESDTCQNTLHTRGHDVRQIESAKGIDDDSIMWQDKLGSVRGHCCDDGAVVIQSDNGDSDMQTQRKGREGEDCTSGSWAWHHVTARTSRGDRLVATGNQRCDSNVIWADLGLSCSGDGYLCARVPI